MKIRARHHNYPFHINAVQDIVLVRTTPGVCLG